MISIAPNIVAINALTIATAVTTVAANAVSPPAKKEPAMTMTEPTTAPKPARKVAKRRKRRSAPATKREPKPAKAAPVPAEFAGLTATACCDACNVGRCVITEIGICGHPLKGGLQPPLMVRPDVVARYARARKAMAHARIDEKNAL